MLGLGIAAALLLPNLLERAYINQEQWVRAGYDYALNFLQPAHLLSTSWGFLPGVPGVPSGTSFQLGAVPVILGAVALVGAGFSWRRSRGERALILFLGGATLVLVLLMLPLSSSIWAVVPLAALIQFPWRLLALTSVTLALLSGLAFLNSVRDAPDARERQDPVRGVRRAELAPPMGSAHEGSILVVALVAVFASYSYTTPQYTPVPPSAGSPLLSIEFELTYTDMRGMTAWTQQMPPDSPLVEQYLSGSPLVTAEALAPGATVEMIRAGGASDELWVRSEAGTALRFFTYYFPGWHVYVDGERLPDAALRPETVYGLITVDVPPGEHRVLLRWGDTPVRKVGKSLTLASLALGLGLLLPASARWRIGSWRRSAS
jgi:hypothetical protein